MASKIIHVTLPLSAGWYHALNFVSSVSLSFSLSLLPSAVETVRKHAGLYQNKTVFPELAEIVLATGANRAYLGMLNNWQNYAKSLGLDWIVVVMEQDALKYVNPDRAITFHGRQIHGEQLFRSNGFNVISCNKLLSVFQIFQQTGLSVVWSDPDNVFRKDPFLPSTGLGNMMRTGAYHFLYQQNFCHRPAPSDFHKLVKEANTGFYWVNAKRDLLSTSLLFQDALQRCQADPKVDDQTHFWNALVSIRQGHAFKHDPRAFEFARLCGKTVVHKTTNHMVFDYCDLDPFEFVTGWKPSKAMHEKRLITYHANCVVGTALKIQKLKDVDLWNSSDQQAQHDSRRHAKHR